MTRKNFTGREKHVLLSIINHYKHVIENKRTDSSSMDIKNKAWDNITRKFNESAEHPRSAKQLQTAYLNHKRLRRKTNSNDNKQIQLTDNGVLKIEIMDDDVTPLSDSYDSAPEYSEQNESKPFALEGNKSFVPDENKPFVPDENKPFALDETEPIVPVKNKSFVPNENKPFVPVENKTSVPVANKPCVSAVPTTLKNVRKTRTRKVPKKKKLISTSTILKTKFYEKKYQCSIIEKSTNMIYYRIAKKKEQLIDLEIKIKEIEYSSKLRELGHFICEKT